MPPGPGNEKPSGWGPDTPLVNWTWVPHVCSKHGALTSWATAGAQSRIADAIGKRRARIGLPWVRGSGEARRQPGRTCDTPAHSPAIPGSRNDPAESAVSATRAARLPDLEPGDVRELHHGPAGHEPLREELEADV